MEAARNPDPITDAFEWIGPTKVDERRDLRDREIERLWAVVKPAIEALHPKPILIGRSIKPMDLLREALNCYQNGAFSAASLMCRSALESLLYVVASSKFTSDSSSEADPDFLHKSSGAFLNEVISRRLLSEADRTIVDDIRQKGNFVAHLSQRMDQGYSNLTRLAREDSNPEGDIPFPKYWLSETDAIVSLRQTADIAAKLLRAWLIEK